MFSDSCICLIQIASQLFGINPEWSPFGIGVYGATFAIRNLAPRLGFRPFAPIPVCKALENQGRHPVTPVGLSFHIACDKAGQNTLGRDVMIIRPDLNPSITHASQLFSDFNRCTSRYMRRIFHGCCTNTLNFLCYRRVECFIYADPEHDGTIRNKFGSLVDYNRAIGLRRRAGYGGNSRYGHQAHAKCQ